MRDMAEMTDKTNKKWCNLNFQWIRVSSYKDIFLLIKPLCSGWCFSLVFMGDACRVKKTECMYGGDRFFKVKNLEAVFNVKSMKCISWVFLYIKHTLHVDMMPGRTNNFKEFVSVRTERGRSGAKIRYVVNWIWVVTMFPFKPPLFHSQHFEFPLSKSIRTAINPAYSHSKLNISLA